MTANIQNQALRLQRSGMKWPVLNERAKQSYQVLLGKPHIPSLSQLPTYTSNVQKLNSSYLFVFSLPHSLDPASSALPSVRTRPGVSPLYVFIPFPRTDGYKE